MNRELTNKIFNDHQLEFIYSLKKMSMGGILFDTSGMIYFLNPSGESFLRSKMSYVTGSNLLDWLKTPSLVLSQLGNGSQSFEQCIPVDSSDRFEFHVFSFENSKQQFSGNVVLFQRTSSPKTKQLPVIEILLRELDNLYFKKRNLQTDSTKTNEFQKNLYQNAIQRIDSILQTPSQSQTISIRSIVSEILSLIRCEGVFHPSSQKPKQVEFLETIEDLELPLEFGNCIALLILELVSNAVLHAFPQNTSGLVEILLRRESEPNQIKLTIRDNGLGFDPSHQNNANFEGVHFVQKLTKGLGGDLLYFTNPGTHYEISLPIS